LTFVRQARRLVDTGQTQVESAEEVTAAEGRIWLARGKAAEAVAAARRLLTIVDAHDTRHWKPPGLLLLAECCLAGGDRDAAREAYTSAAGDAERMGGLPALWRALAGLAEVRQASGDAEAALASARRAHEIIERLASSMGDERLRATFLQSARVQRVIALAG
jgi:tetratricopeptide (TPR) repeat protein